MVIRRRGKNFEIDVQGGGYRVRRTVKTEKEAKELHAKISFEIQEHTHSGRMNRAPKKTFGEAMVRWLKSGAPDSMKSHARCVAPHMKDVLLKDCASAANEMLQSFIASGLKPATINRRLAIVKRILNLSYDQWGWLDEPLARKIKGLSEKNQRHYYLTPAQVEQLATACECLPARHCILIAAYTGLRRSEIFRLEKNNYRDGMIFLTAQTKSGKPRAVPVPSRITSICEQLPIPITPDMLRSNFEKARVKIKMPWLHFHDLRHTYASWLAGSSDVPVTLIRDLLGHSSLSVTSRYAHLSSATFDIDAALSGGKNR